MADIYESMSCDESLCDSQCCINSRCGFSYFECNMYIVLLIITFGGFYAFFMLTLICWKFRCCMKGLLSAQTYPHNDVSKPVGDGSMTQDYIKGDDSLIMPEYKLKDSDSIRKSTSKFAKVIAETNVTDTNMRTNDATKKSVRNSINEKPVKKENPIPDQTNDNTQMDTKNENSKNNSADDHAIDESQNDRYDSHAESDHGDDELTKERSRSKLRKNQTYREVQLDKPKHKKMRDSRNESEGENEQEIEIKPQNSKKTGIFVPESTFSPDSEAGKKRGPQSQIKPF